ncbi:heme peroxidase, partial [Lophiotrema nucula]
AAIWKNRAAFKGSGLVAASKDVIPDIPLNDPVNGLLTRGVVHYLWGSMLHPPMSYRGSKHQYRTPDGSNHNALFPDLGKAGLPYAKSVQGQRAMLGAKPDPGDLFDLLMAREEIDNKGRESDTGISSFLLYQATIVIHDIFRTNADDRNISDTSSYLDLAPLYGSNQEAQNSIRFMKDGLLKPDTFADHRLVNQPPGVSVFLIMYNRFHNYVAKQMLEINENGRFALPADFVELDVEGQKQCLDKRDDDLFQTARLITCGLYAQIAIHDYLRCLMMMHAKDTAWTLDPRAEYNGLLDRGTLKRGEGNMVSVEFNLLYRFHSAISVRDANWSTELLKLWLHSSIDDDATEKEIASGEKMTSGDFSDMKNHPERAFGFRRDPKTGFFDDSQLVAELVRSMEDPICSFGARQIPKAFKSIEILGILQSRKWEVATLNEFRQFFGMKKHERFEDITTDPIIVERLRDLYEDPDMVEMYPGYLCEGGTRNLDPNVSCPGSGATTLWRGVFSDAVTLVRSDRFYTTDWNVDSITAWGMSEVASDSTINKGGLLHRLCQRAFPGYFSYNSLHLWEPYYTPARNLVLAEEQGFLDDLDLSD